MRARVVCASVQAPTHGTFGVAWRVFLAVPVVHADAALMSLALGVAPYAIVLALGRGARQRSAAIACAVAVFAVDVTTGVDAMRTTSSTGAVAVLLAPVVSALCVALVLGANRIVTRQC